MIWKNKIMLTLVVGLAVVTILGFLYYLYNGNPFLRYERMNQVEDHIVENGGSLENIEDISANWFTSRGDFDINVVFEDEPELTYVYLYFNSQEGIILSGIYEGEPFGDSIRLEEGKNGSIEEEGREDSN
ncbi:DUF3139 domain-containing protein [Alkalihalobacillus sp. NPDC078783]